MTRIMRKIKVIVIVQMRKEHIEAEHGIKLPNEGAVQSPNLKGTRIEAEATTKTIEGDEIVL
jgi:hypothetical protein